MIQVLNYVHWRLKHVRYLIGVDGITTKRRTFLSSALTLWASYCAIHVELGAELAGLVEAGYDEQEKTWKHIYTVKAALCNYWLMLSHFNFPFTKDYWLKIVFCSYIRLVLSLLFWPNVITFSGFYCWTESDGFVSKQFKWSQCLILKTIFTQ